MPHLEVTEIVLIVIVVNCNILNICNIVNNNYRQGSGVLYIFFPNKLLIFHSGILYSLKNFNLKLSYIEVWFTD